MRTSWTENHAVLRGTAAAEPVFSHTNHGVDFFLFPLTVPRLSGAEDRLNVVAPAPLLADFPLTPGRRVEVAGEVRTFNNRTGPGSRLVITLLARALTETEEPPCNQLTLSGVLCKPPILRRTPLGREICDLMLAVNRRYGRADYLPCIAWGALAQRCAGLAVGDGGVPASPAGDMEPLRQAQAHPRQLVGGAVCGFVATGLILWLFL